MSKADSPKFTEYDRLIAFFLKDKAAVVLIHHSQILGDNYEENCVNLGKLASADLVLKIVSPAERMEVGQN